MFINTLNFFKLYIYIMSKINYNQLNILSKDQLLNILKNLLNQIYNKIDNDYELVIYYNKKYNINKDINEMSKEEIIQILLKFYPNSC